MVRLSVLVMWITLIWRPSLK